MIRGRNSNFLLPDYLKAVYDELEREEKRRSEIQNGEFLKVNGRVGEVLKAEKKKKSKPFLDEIDEVRFRSVLVEKAVEDAVKKARMLRMRKKDFRKNIVEKPVILELPKIALHGGDVHKLMSWEVLKELVKDAERC
jgi:hypothetical protein